jgi:hypothetical protein
MRLLQKSADGFVVKCGSGFLKYLLNVNIPHYKQAVTLTNNHLTKACSCLYFLHSFCIGFLKMALKKRATRDELFGRDEFSCPWREHQLERISRLHKIKADALALPVSAMRLCYEDKCVLELFGRDGRQMRYRPAGVILHQELISDDVGMMEFEVAWVDPWGYAHTATRNFIDVRLKSVPQLDQMRALRNYRQAVERNWVKSSKGKD